MANHLGLALAHYLRNQRELMIDCLPHCGDPATIEIVRLVGKRRRRMEHRPWIRETQLIVDESTGIVQLRTRPAYAGVWESRSYDIADPNFTRKLEECLLQIQSLPQGNKIP